MAVQAGFFGVEDRLAAISAGGDPLERLSRVVDFELFREELHDALGRGPKPKNNGGRLAHARANAARCSKVRSCVEHVFAELKDRMGLFVRTIGLERAKAKIGLANLAYNMKRLVWLDSRTAPA
jgi:Transposase DDE domain